MLSVFLLSYRNTCESLGELKKALETLSCSLCSHSISCSPGLKVNDQLVAYATRFLAVRLKKYVWSHHRALKVEV